VAFRELVFPLLMVTLMGPSSFSVGPSPTGSGTDRIGFVPVPQVGAWAWPVQGPVIRGFAPPDTPFGAGHRGIDIAAAPGTPILAPEAGTVSFAGRVGGELFVTIVHGGGLSSTYSWISSTTVGKGDVALSAALRSELSGLNAKFAATDARLAPPLRARPCRVRHRRGR